MPDALVVVVSKIAAYTVTLRESYTALSIEAWQRDDGSLCLYVWPLKSLDTYELSSSEAVWVDWTGPDSYQAGIGEVYDYQEICTVVPDPGAVSGIVALLALLLLLRKWRI